MTVWISSIITGIVFYIALAPVVLAAFFIKDMLMHRKCIEKYLFDQLFVAYILVVLALVFFPLPDAETAKELSEYTGRYIPFSFVADVIKDKSVESVLQVLFNVCMTIPFGMYLNYCTKAKKAETVMVTFFFSLFIELGQLTGLFFLYSGSYRLFDVDDLLLNTLGGFTGYLIIERLEHYQTVKSKIPAWKIALKIA